MLDKEGYRPNVGIILLNRRNEVFWGKRIREHAWQFPQGGIKRGESPEQAMFRELEEEVGLLPNMCASSAAPATGCAMKFRITGSGESGGVTTGARSRSGISCASLGVTATFACAPPTIPSSMPGAGITTGFRSNR